MFKDLIFALRTLRKSPAFTAVAVTSLALGIGADTAIFSFVNAILLKQLPAPEPKRLVSFARSFRGETADGVWPMSTIAELAKQDSVFDGVFGRFAKPVSFSMGEKAQWVMGELVTGQYFQTMQVKPFMGRLLTDGNVRDAAANPVCVLSYGIWRREFGGDPHAVGRTVFLNGHSYRVLGVTAKDFMGADLQHRIDLQIPATRIGDFMPAFGGATGLDWLKTLSWLTPMARLKAGVTRLEAQIRTQQILDRIEGSSKAEDRRTLRLEDGSKGFSTMRSEFGRPVLVLMAVAAVVLLVACANLANLLLARAQTRAKELAVRMSIGASRFRLIRQLLVESLLLAAGGGVSGLLLSFWITKALLAFLNMGRSAASALVVSPDMTVLAFSIALSFATAIVFGLIPAWQATRPALLPGLTGAVSGSAGVSRAVMRRAMVVAQIALSLVVLFAAGLLTRTLKALETVDLGFKPDHVIALNVDPAASGHSSVEVSRLLDEILERARAFPGVTAASLAASTPNGSMAISMNVDVPGYTPKRAGDDVSDFNFVSPSYFETLGQPLLRGRDFGAGDDKNSPRVAIVNRKFARKYWGDRDVIGRKFRQGGSEVEIVGLVADARDQGIKNGSEEAVYLPEKQSETSGLTVLVRTANRPNDVIPSLLAIVRAIDKRLPVASVQTLDSQIRAGLSSEEILGYLSALFAALSTLLAGIGIYGVLSYSITRRTREIGVRFAIGAQTADIAVLFARESLILVVLGLIIGGPLALVAVQVLKTTLFGVTATDAPTLFVSVGVLATAACLAIALPLWRAARVNPLVALRYE